MIFKMHLFLDTPSRDNCDLMNFANTILGYIDKRSEDDNSFAPFSLFGIIEVFLLVL